MVVKNHRDLEHLAIQAEVFPEEVFYTELDLNPGQVRHKVISMKLGLYKCFNDFLEEDRSNIEEACRITYDTVDILRTKASRIDSKPLYALFASLAEDIFDFVEMRDPNAQPQEPLPRSPIGMKYECNADWAAITQGLQRLILSKNNSRRAVEAFFTGQRPPSRVDSELPAQHIRSFVTELNTKRCFYLNPDKPFHTLSKICTIDSKEINHRSLDKEPDKINDRVQAALDFIEDFVG